MFQKNNITIARRDFLRALNASAVGAAASTIVVTEAHADSESNDEKRKARYKADSEDVKAFYRVNHYPK